MSPARRMDVEQWGGKAREQRGQGRRAATRAEPSSWRAPNIHAWAEPRRPCQVLWQERATASTGIGESVPEWSKNTTIPLNTSPFSRQSRALVKDVSMTWVSLPGTGTLRPNGPRERCEFGGAMPSCVPRLQLGHFHRFPHPPSSCCCADPVPRISFLHWRQTFPFSRKTFLYNISSKWPHPRSFREN